MKVGEVVTVRVPPEDMMTCLDICESTGVALYGASVAQLVRLALSALCEAARSSGLAPTHDGFDYLARVSKYKKLSHEVKLNAARGLERVQSQALAQDLPRSLIPKPMSIANSHIPRDTNSPDYKRKIRRFLELRAKRVADPINFGDAEKQEMDELLEWGVKP